MGTELPGFHPCVMNFPATIDQPVEAELRFSRCRGRGEAGSHATAGVGGQCELADQQQCTAGVVQRTVHLAGIVGENAVTKQSLCHSRDLRLAVAWFNGDQREQARTNRADDGIVHGHIGFSHALDEGKHGAILNCEATKRAARLNPMSKLTAALLYALAWSIARLPWPLLATLADAIASWWIRVDARESRVARRNLELATPNLDADARVALHREILRTTARQAMETLRMWTRPASRNLADIAEMHGADLFDAALADTRGPASRGLIVAAPHMGNWELLNQWLAMKTPLAILYRPPESPTGEAFLRRVRANAGRQVEQVRAEAGGVRTLLKRLQKGGVIGILPDQQPKVGDGEFAPFFEVQALTMTLLGRIAARSGARVLVAWCERVPESSPPRFALHVQEAPDAIADADAKTSVAALNAMVEAIARRDLAQYQWTYKRYTLRPSGSGEVNPYTGRF